MSQKGFTLIELLVVIAIIALLLAVLLPALNKVKMQAKTVICSVNCKSMAIAWSTYALENADKIVSSYTGYGGFTDYLIIPANPYCANPWVGWAGYPSANDSIQARERQARAIEHGVLYPYVETTKVYRCPASKKHEIRSFSIPEILGYQEPDNVPPRLGDLAIVTKVTQVKSPSSRIVFLDEGYATFAGYTIPYIEHQWWDYPPIRHDKGVTLGYVDGHADFYKWRDKQTIKAGEAAETWGAIDSQVDNPDLKMMQIGIFGKLGY